GRPRVVDVLGELQRALNVLARSFEVAMTAPAARAVLEDLGAELVARETRALCERQRLVEEAEGGLDARELVAADAERQQYLRALHVREGRALHELARPGEPLERGTEIAEPGVRARRPVEGANLELGQPRRAGGG